MYFSPQRMRLINISLFYISVLIQWIQKALSTDIMNVVHFIQQSMAFHLKKNKQYMRENRNHLRACCLIGKVSPCSGVLVVGWHPFLRVLAPFISQAINVVSICLLTGQRTIHSMFNPRLLLKKNRLTSQSVVPVIVSVKRIPEI